MAKRAGTLLIGQSGGGTAVINGSLAGAVVTAEQMGVGRILGMRHGIEGVLREEFIDLSHLEAPTIQALRRTPSGVLGLCRYKMTEDDETRALETLRRWDVRWLLYIGGNDSAETAARLSQKALQNNYELAIISIPKTIDNDLPITDHTPGYGTAARFVSSATRFLDADARAMRSVDRVRVLEVYGRDTGWLAAASALAKDRADAAPHIILPPEIPFRAEHFLGAVTNVVRRCDYAVVVVGEMLRDATGALVGSVQGRTKDAFGNEESRRPGDYIEDLIERELGMPAKDDRPGSLHKVAAWSYSHVDADEAFAVGEAGVKAALAGHTAMMVTIVRDSRPGPYASSTGLTDVGSIVRAVKPLPPHYFDADTYAVTDQFLTYARPLIGDPLPELACFDTYPLVGPTR